MPTLPHEDVDLIMRRARRLQSQAFAAFVKAAFARLMHLPVSLFQKTPA